LKAVEILHQARVFIASWTSLVLEVLVDVGWVFKVLEEGFDRVGFGTQCCF